MSGEIVVGEFAAIGAISEVAGVSIILQLVIEARFDPGSGAAVEQFFFQVSIEGLVDLPASVLHRLRNTLQIDVLVLDAVEHGIEP